MSSPPVVVVPWPTVLGVPPIVVVVLWLVDESDLASTTRFAYTQNAQRFVRWLNGQYEIGPDEGSNGSSTEEAQSQGGKRGGSR